MQAIRNDASLQQAILDLESKRSQEAAGLREQWDYTRKNLNPLTLLKDGVKDTLTSPNLGAGLLKGLLSLGAGFVTKKLVVGSSGGVVRKVFGTIAQTGATSLAFKGSDLVKEKAAPFLSRFLKKLKVGN